MNKYFHYLLFLSLFQASSLYGQYADNFEKAVLAALDSSQFYTYDDFFGSSSYDSLTVKDQFLFAEAARRMGAYGIAESAYIRTIHLDSLENKEYYPQARYWQGAMNQTQGNYQAAIYQYKLYLDSPPPVDNDRVALAKQNLEDCQFALERMKTSDAHYQITHLGEQVNSPFSDISPFWYKGELYFSSLKYELKNDKVDPPRLFAKTLKTDLAQESHPIADLNIDNITVAHPTLSLDGQRMYFTRCDYVGKSRILNCGLYYREKKQDGSWGRTEELPNHINQNGFTSTQPAIGYDEAGNEMLYFVSNRPDGKGGLDIWYSKVLEGDFGPVKNHPVNTKSNDITPFYHVPTKMLYFSSNGRKGMGGYDIYSHNGTSVLHEGYPLNSSFNDFFFTLDPTGEKGHFSSNRQGCIRLNEVEKGCEDIFAVSFQRIDVKVLAYDDTKEALIGVTTQIQEMDDQDCAGTANTIFDETHAADNTFLQSKLKKDAWYQVIASKEGYQPDTICISTNNINTSKEIIQEVYLQPNQVPVNLLALIFDKNTKLPLNNCIVQLEDKQSGELYIKDNSTANEFDFPIYTNRAYCLIATSVGYSSDTLCFDTKGLAKGTNLTKELFLQPDIQELKKMLPMTLYFDNDYPDPKSRATTTTSNYEDLFYPYYRKQAEYVFNYTNNKSASEKARAESEVRDFFEDSLRMNFDKLGIFSEALISYLRSGQSATITIRGFASPLAQPDYNSKLSSRRVDCVKNHFESYRKGIFLPYIQNKQLVLEEEALGEGFKRGERVSYIIPSNSNDKSNSIYSPAASLRRKVEIEDVSIDAVNN